MFSRARILEAIVSRSAFFTLLFVGAFGVAVAAPPGSPFNLGETLTPACAPGDVNCTVVTPAASGNNTDITGLALQSDTDADITQTTAGTGYSSLEFFRSEGTNALPTLVSNDEELGEIGFYGYDGDEFVEAALIDVNVNSTPGNDDMPGRIDFYTTPDDSDTLVKRMTLDDDGELGIGTDVPAELLVLEGDGADADMNLRIYEGATSENPTVFMDFAEGTAAAPANVSSDQTVAHMVGRAYAGAAFEEIASINFVVDDSTGADDHAGRIDFYTSSDNTGGPDSALLRRFEIQDDGEVAVNPDHHNVGGEELMIGPSEDEPGSISSDTAISMVNGVYVYEFHVEDDDEFYIFENEDEDRFESVIAYHGSSDTWGFGQPAPDHTDGDASNDTHLFVVDTSSGDAYLSTSGVWTNASSRDYKESIEDLSLADALSVLFGLEPKSYYYKNDNSGQYLGFIAEDVPELVATADRKGMAAMDIVAVLTKVVQDQEERLQDQEERLQALEALIAQ